MYDAVVGRMLSADKYVADASNSQDYNRYSYVRNNPLKYTDPSGWRLHYSGPSDNANDGGVNGDGNGGGSRFVGNTPLVGTAPMLTSWGTTMLGATFYAPSQQYYVNQLNGNYMLGNKVIDRKQYLAGSYITKNMLGRVSYYKGEWGFWINNNSSEDNGNLKGDNSIGFQLPETIIKPLKWVPFASSESVDFGLTTAGTMNDLLLTSIEHSNFIYRNVASEAQILKAFSKISGGVSGLKYAGGLGVALTALTAYNEYKSGNADTHTLIDIGITGGSLIASGTIVGLSALGIITAPAWAPLAIAGVGLTWGITSFIASDAIDKATNHWGQKNIFYNKKP